jgi:glycosyltransferase involved in cell wall biosynthesis
MIVFLCSSGIGFPDGTAATGRLRSYAQGLAELGKQVFILMLGTSEYGEVVFNTQTSGEINSIGFEYACGTTVRGRTFLLRRWYQIKGPMVAALRIFQLRKRNPIEALVMYYGSPFSTTLFWLISRLLKCPLLLENSEHPFFRAGEKEKGKFYQAIYTHLVYKRFDGVMVISRYLQELLVNILRRDAKIIKIPIFVDMVPYENSSEDFSKGGRNITYCGLLNEAKDGVLSLMKAFQQIADEFPDVILRLVGDSYTKSHIPEFQVYAQELGIAEKVEFTGMVSREKIPEYLKQATVLALARPNSLQAQAGFPSKVGEYLASGKPAVVTRTGELTDYLTDGVNIYFSEPDNVQMFAERLRYVLNHPEESRAVGLNGQAAARQYFDYKVNIERFITFIDSFY